MMEKKQHYLVLQKGFCIVAIVLILCQYSQAHTKGRRVDGGHGSSSYRIPPMAENVNSTQTQLIEKQFMMWVLWVGTLRHSVFRIARNKLLPAFYIRVDKTPGKGDFTTVKKAIDSLPPVNLLRVTIKINGGFYKEKIEIPIGKAFITLEGAGADKTVIAWGDRADTRGPGGHPIGTKYSATFAVDSPFFIAKNITFKNTAPVPPPGAVGKQAVAFRISGDAAQFVGCKFLGAQDTLYDDQGRHYFKDCYIEGSVDFVFGNALSLYEGCHLHAISNGIGALTAQKRSSLLDDTGFSFLKCKITGSGALYLGRAWGTFSRVVFAYTYMDNIIVPKGWYNWGDPTRELTVFYGQYKCTGPGATYSGRVSWSRELTDQEAKPFISLSFIDGEEWISSIF